jgi:ankyrin repeat protein
LKDTSSLYIASKLGFAEIVKLLVEYGVQVNVPYEVNGAKINK